MWDRSLWCTSQPSSSPKPVEFFPLLAACGVAERELGLGVVRGVCDGSVEGVVGVGTFTGNAVEAVRFCVAWMQIGVR